MTAASRKRCPDCRETLPVESFWRNRRTHDGRQRYCKPCLKARQTESLLLGMQRSVVGAAEVSR
jgi:hypothetical protein